MRQSGFTMIEIIAILLLISIIGAIAVSRYMTSDTDLITQTEIIKAHIRYAQSRAMNTNSVWGIRLEGSQYYLFDNGSTDNKVKLPGEDSDTLSMSSGISVTTATIAFDDWGKPYTDAAATTAQVGDLTITVTGSSGTKSIIITQNTGFIQ